MHAAGRCTTTPGVVGTGSTGRHPSGVVTFERMWGRWAWSWAICFLLRLHLQGDAHQQVVGSEMQAECKAFC